MAAGRWLLEVAALAVACLATGWTAVAAADSPAAMPVWPPVGIALVALYARGRRLWPGVWAGTFAALVGPGGLSPGVAAGLAAAAALQAAVGVWLLRRVVGRVAPLVRQREILGFLAVAGPAHAAVGPVVGGLVAVAAGGGMGAAVTAVGWWGAGAAGGLVFAPLTLVVLGRPREVWRPRLRTVGLPLAATVGLTATVFVMARGWEADAARRHFAQTAAAAVREVEGEARTLEASFARFQLTGQWSVLNVRFEPTVAGERAGQLCAAGPAVRSAAVVAVVPAAHRRAFERPPAQPETRLTEAGADGRLRPVADRPVYYPVVYTHPAAAGTAGQPVGYDLGAEPVWRPLVAEASRTGRPAAAAPDLSAERPLIRVVVPCLGESDPGQPLPRTATGRPVCGCLMVELDPVAMMAPAQARLGAEVTVAVATTAPADGAGVIDSFSLAGRPVVVNADATPAYLAGLRPRYAAAVGWAGVLLAVLLTAHLLVATGQTALVAEEVTARTAALNAEVDARRGVEASLRESEARLTEAQRLARLGYWEWHPAADDMYWSPVLAEMLGFVGSDRRMQFEDLVARVHPDDRAFFRTVVAGAPHGRTATQPEFRSQGVDGRVRWLSATVTAVTAPRSRAGGGSVRGTVIDITERKRHELALRDGQARLGLALSSARMGTWEWDLDAGAVRWDERQEALFGLPPGGFDGRMATFQASIHPADRPAVEAAAAAALTGSDFQAEFRVLRPPAGGAGGPEVRWLAGHGQLLATPDGRGRRMFGVNYDITPRKEAEQVLRATEASLAEAQRIARTGSFDWEPATGRTWWSDEMYRILGYEPQSVDPTYVAFVARVHPADQPRVAARMAATMRHDAPYQFEFRVVRPDGETRVVRADAALVRDAAGAVTHFRGTNQDVTERRAAEEAVRAGEARLAEAQRIAHLGSWETDPATGEFWGSAQAFESFGLPADRPVRAAAVFALFPPADRGRADRAIAAALRDGGRFEFEHVLVRPDGDARHMVTSGVVAYPEADRPRILGTSQDVTDRKREDDQRRAFQERLQQTQKLESLGILAGGVAHDFNNLLTGILGNASLARETIPAGSDLHDYLRPIESAAEHAAQLCLQLVTYAGRGGTTRGPVDLNRLIDESADLLRLATSRRAGLRVELDRGLPSLVGDASQLRQVILNLVQNASEALPAGGGTVTVRTGVAGHAPSHDPATTTCSGPHPAGEYVWFEVADTGCGIDPAGRVRIFEPFFTTKFTGRGLGLSAVHGIVRGHGGVICVTSTMGEGTTFRVAVPIAPVPESDDSGGETPPPALTPRPAVWAGPEGLVALVAADDHTVRGLAAVALKALGFRVVQADTGAAAVELLRADPDLYQVALVDVAAPGPAGRPVADELADLRSDLPVVVLSGDPGDPASGPALHVLQKPFRAVDLTACVRRAMGATAVER